MSEEQEDQDAKTEEPTHKKLADAVEKGQVINSKEVSNFIILLFLTIVTIWVIPYISSSLLFFLKSFIAKSTIIIPDQGGLYQIFPYIIKKILLYLSPVFLIVALAAIISSYSQSGEFIFTAHSIIPKLSKISPFQGFKRIFSFKSFVEFLKGIFKITLVGTLVILIIIADIKELTQYQELSVAGIIDQLFTMIKHILILVTIITAILAALDYAYQSYEYYKQLRMTKQEVKEEYKNTEGNPQIKQKLHQIRRERARNNLRSQVPKATVIITNPEHYAVALQYEVGSGSAPICVTKGLDLIAQIIKELGQEHEVPIIEDPPLARALHKDTNIGDEIDLAYFEPVAKIISHIMSLEKKKK
jgi:flagellar biosynthetic protein FlhB